ncbi:MAG: fumarylacetoacetate hydrolase family protein [Gammaproteobacteria bacterium]
MIRARVAYAGAIHEAVPATSSPAPSPPSSPSPSSSPSSSSSSSSSSSLARSLDDASLRLDDGRVVGAQDVVWLPPFAAGTIIALGLNYADHAKELAFNAEEEPLVFLKGPGSLLGHRGVTRRPAGVKFMHYECELAVVIGRPAKQVSRSQARLHVGGYCIANDYAIRDYLENWYRPNLRVKNRDGATVLGPWLVDAADVADAGNLGLRTYVNDKLTQQGNTRDLIYDVSYLVEYLSSFMTLYPGDVILTGTPEGVINVMPGDVVACEIDGLGRLVNTIAADAEFGR